MANVFKVPIINPFRFVNSKVYAETDPRYNTYPFDYVKDGYYNPNGFYAQKWQKNDFTSFQFDSDFEGATFKIYHYCDNILYKEFAVVEKDIAIVGQTWKAFEVAVNFADWDEGMYYGVLSYVDENEETQDLQTSPLDVRVKHTGTLLYEYFHTFNDKGIVWDTGIKMSIRIEGVIREFDPKSLSDEYVDQKYNTYSLNDIPYRAFTNYIGLARGLPDWYVDKMSVIFTVNSLTIDGTPYCKLSGQSFEMTRPTNGYNENGYASIKIIPNENYNLEAYITGLTPDGGFKVIAKVLPYYSNAANIAINGIFKTHTKLQGIAIWNRGANPFTLNVGTTNGGTQIGQYEITDDITSYVEINKVFEGAANVFLTGLDGTDLDLDIEYYDYDAPNSNPGGASGGFVPNVEYTYYEEVIGDFDRDWNAATGLGNPDTAFEGCRLLDDDDFLFRMGWPRSIPEMRDTIVGNTGNQLSISRSNLPAEGIYMFTDQENDTPDNIPIANSNDWAVRSTRVSGNSRNYLILKGTNPPNVGKTENLGSGDPTDITPEAKVVARFIKLSVEE